MNRAGRPLVVAVACAAAPAFAIVAASALAAGSAPAPRRELDNVAAWARLYGVVRYFYPSDAAEELDWNRLAVHGVAQARAARDARALAAALESLVAPLGPGIEIGRGPRPAAAPAPSSEPLVAWRYQGAGFPSAAGLYSSEGDAYKRKRTHRPAPALLGGAFRLSQTVPAEMMRGKAVRLRGRVRAAPTSLSGAAALWLRVERPKQRVGFFEDMRNRPIRDREWRQYAIEGSVAEDAVDVLVGLNASGGVTADFDEIELAVRDAAGAWTAVPLDDAGFEAPATDAAAGPWKRNGMSEALVSRPTEQAPEGRQFLRAAPPPPGEGELFGEGAPELGARVDVDLGSGLQARVALALTDTQARVDPARAGRFDALKAALASLPGPGERPGLDERLADVVTAWNVLRHFSPYWADSGVDWNARLQPQLESAWGAETRAAELQVLRALVHDCQDGHGAVEDRLDRGERGVLPIRLAPVEGRLAITASDVAEVPVGSVLLSIDGVAAAERLAREEQLVSGSPQWRRGRAARQLGVGPKGGRAQLVVDTAAGRREVALSYTADAAPLEARPDAVSALEPGVWYVDLTRATMDQLKPVLATLAAARAVVFDVRGYPTGAGYELLPHLLDAPEGGRWMHVAKIVGPFGRTAGWLDHGWDMKPTEPRVAGTRVFLTDGRAISYAESVMGYVADLKLGTIVGSATAGTNGNICTFDVPGGYVITFTGMRVTRHDGYSRHHLLGVQPDVTELPTLAAIRAGRDVVLERALKLLHDGPGALP